MDYLANYFIIGFASFLIFLLLFQVRRLRRIKNSLDVFLSDLRNLNRSTKKIVSLSNDEYININKPDSVEEKICENCKSRVTFLDYVSENVFYYKCKLNNENITLNHSCKNFQKDFQNYKI